MLLIEKIEVLKWPSNRQEFWVCCAISSF